jgi:uncharacterized protein (TIGR03067 family)
MKKHMVPALLAALCAVMLYCCSLNANGARTGNSLASSSLLFDAVKNAAPVFPGSEASRTATWDWGGPVFEVYNAFKDYDPAADNGTVGIDNIYKLLYQNSSFFADCLNDGTTTADQQLASPYYLGRTDNTYNKILIQESAAQASYFAAKQDGTVNHGLLCWYREYGDGHKERGILQGHFDSVTGDVNVDLVCFVEYATSVYSHRTHLEGNSLTHRFTKLLIGKWNGGSATYRAWFAGSGMAQGAGNTFLFKIADDDHLTTAKYFDFPSDAGVAELQAMSDDGSDTTSSPYRTDVDAMVANHEYFDIITDTPSESAIPSSAGQFHGTGLGNMKPAAETELEGAWYGKTFNLTVNGNYFQLRNAANTQWFMGNLALDTGADPKTIDFNVTEASDTSLIGKTFPGIYKIENGVLLLKISQDNTRPVDFSIPNGMLFAFGRDPNSLPDIPGGFAFEPLEMFYANLKDVGSVHAFAIPDWSGPGKPHNGIDLRIKSNLTKSTIISPCHGIIQSITYNVTDSNTGTPGLLMVHVNIFIDGDYSCSLVFEPCDTIDFLNTQLSALKVTIGQEVHAGDVIGDILAGQYSSTDPAGVHIMLTKGDMVLCPHCYSSPTAKAIYEQLVETVGGTLNNGTIDGGVESFPMY